MAYTITGRKSGSVRFEPDTIGNIQSEAVSMSSKVTSNPIENGADINDHVVKDPVKFSISGTIIGGQQGQQTLQTMRDRRDIVTYTGRVRIANLVITSLSFDYGAKNAKGCTFKVSFQQVNISSSEVVEVGAMPMMTQQDTREALRATRQPRPRKPAATGSRPQCQRPFPAAPTPPM